MSWYSLITARNAEMQYNLQVLKKVQLKSRKQKYITLHRYGNDALNTSLCSWHLSSDIALIQTLNF